LREQLSSRLSSKLSSVEFRHGGLAWVGWSFTWENVTAGEYTLRCRAKDERGNMSKDDDSVHDYYAMDPLRAAFGVPGIRHSSRSPARPESMALHANHSTRSRMSP
jgi:hypothetical protein